MAEAEKVTITKDDVTKVSVEELKAETPEERKARLGAETPEERKARRKLARKTRLAKPIAIPDPAKFEGPAKEQLMGILEASKAFVDTVKSASDVIPQALTSIRRGVNQAISIHLRTARQDPVEKRKARLELQIAKAQEKLAELLQETEAGE